MHLLDRDPRTQRERDQAPDRLSVGHRRAAGLAEVDEDLEGLALIVLGDVHEHHAERGLLADRRRAEDVRTRPLLAALEVLGLRVEEQLLEAIVVAPELRELPLELGELALRGRLLLGPVALRRSIRGGAGREHLAVTRPIAVDGDTLALHLIRQLVDLAHVLAGRGVREVRRLGDGGVAVLLERRLHLDVPLRRDVVRRREDLLPLHRDLRVLHRTGLGDPLHEGVGVPPLARGDRDEILVHVGHHDAGLIAHEGDREEGLQPRRAAGDDRDRPGRGDGGDVAVAELHLRTDAVPRLVTRAGGVGPPDGTLPLGEGAALLRETHRLLLPLDVDELHHLATERHPLSAVVFDA